MPNMPVQLAGLFWATDAQSVECRVPWNGRYKDFSADSMNKSMAFVNLFALRRKGVHVYRRSFISNDLASDRLRLWWLLSVCVLGLIAPVFAHAATVDVAELAAEKSERGLVVSARMSLELAPVIEDALHKGIPMFFVAEAELLRDRWYWYDKKVTHARRYMRLAFHPLTQRWRLNSSSEPLGHLGFGAGIVQTYDSLSDALKSVQRISRWKVAELAEIDPDSSHTLNFRFRLDLTQLPRPFQLGVAGQADWNVSAVRSTRVPADVGR